MRFPWIEALATVWAAVAATEGAAQQRVREIGVQAVVTSSEPVLLVAGPYAGFRPSSRTRLSLDVGAGISDDDFAWRGEALAHFLLSPAKRQGWGVYFAGGVAAVGGPVSRGYLVLTLGTEQGPAAASGWMAELGVGGGVRVSAGYRWRHGWAK
jgi:hypothetical protein